MCFIYIVIVVVYNYICFIYIVDVAHLLVVQIGSSRRMEFINKINPIVILTLSQALEPKGCQNLYNALL